MPVPLRYAAIALAFPLPLAAALAAASGLVAGEVPDALGIATGCAAGASLAAAILLRPLVVRPGTRFRTVLLGILALAVGAPLAMISTALLARVDLASPDEPAWTGLAKLLFVVLMGTVVAAGNPLLWPVGALWVRLLHGAARRDAGGARAGAPFARSPERGAATGGAGSRGR